jgi:inosine-uridine nucleoside N-ribohydrolase
VPQLEARILDVVWDMETNDPDDFLTLLLLAGHPRVNLKAVTITPGSPHQVGLVRWALAELGQPDIPVGAGNLLHPAECVSSWHWAVFGKRAPSRNAAPAAEVLRACCDDRTTLITGAPPKNLGAALADAARLGEPFALARWVAQGGFAGEGVVPPEQQLPKFFGRRTCPSFNVNGAPRVVLEALEVAQIADKRFVSKNVCHGVSYDAAMHAEFGAVCDRSLALSMIHRSMGLYLQRRRDGKLMHDPLAACCAIDLCVGRWAEVDIFRERGEWGSRLSPGSGVWITVGYDHQRFLDTLLAVE